MTTLEKVVFGMKLAYAIGATVLVHKLINDKIDDMIQEADNVGQAMGIGFMEGALDCSVLGLSYFGISQIVG